VGDAHPSGVISNVISPAAWTSPRKSNLQHNQTLQRSSDERVRMVSSPLVSPEQDTKVGNVQAQLCAGG